MKINKNIYSLNHIMQLCDIRKKLLKFIFIILVLNLVLFTSCQSTNKVNYEKLALTYFVDSVFYKVSFNKKNSILLYDGLVTGRSRHYDEPIEVMYTPQYSEVLGFYKSYMNNNVKDFYIEPNKNVKNKSFEEYQKRNNDNECYIKVKHYIQSGDKILVKIDLIYKKEVTKEAYIFLNLEGVVIDCIEADTIFPYQDRS